MLRMKRAPIVFLCIGIVLFAMLLSAGPAFLVATLIATLVAPGIARHGFAGLRPRVQPQALLAVARFRGPPALLS